MNDKILSLLGLCRRAGKVSLGRDAVIDAVEKRTSKLVIMASDISPHTQKDILRACHAKSVKSFTLNRTKDELSHGLGKFCGVISVNDGGFANKLAQLISEETEQEACL